MIFQIQTRRQKTSMPPSDELSASPMPSSEQNGLACTMKINGEFPGHFGERHFNCTLKNPSTTLQIIQQALSALQQPQTEPLQAHSPFVLGTQCICMWPCSDTNQFFTKIPNWHRLFLPSYPSYSMARQFTSPGRNCPVATKIVYYTTFQ